MRPHGGAAFQAAQHAERTKDISREKAGHVGECHTGRLLLKIYDSFMMPC